MYCINFEFKYMFNIIALSKEQLRKVFNKLNFVSHNRLVNMNSSSHSSQEIDAADGLVSLSTDAYRDNSNIDGDTSTDATTVNSNRADDSSNRSGRDGEMSNDVTNSTSSSLETIEGSSEDTSSVETGWLFDNLIH